MWLVSFAIIVSEICWFFFFFFFFLCFVGGIFRFANFPSRFATFLGFFGY